MSKPLMKTALWSAILSICLLVSEVITADVTLATGTVLRGYAITGLEANGLRVTHADGATLVDFDDLPAALKN